MDEKRPSRFSETGEYTGITLATLSEYYGYALEGLTADLPDERHAPDPADAMSSFSSVGTTRVSGYLDEFPLPYLVAALKRKGETGRLHVYSFDTERVIYFENGEVICAQSNGFTESLIHTVLSSGKLPAAARRIGESLSLDVDDDDDEFALALMNKGLFDEQEMQRWVRRQYRSIITGAFQIEDGSFSFTSTGITNFTFQIDTSSVATIVAGLRCMTSFEQVNRMLPPFNTSVQLAQPVSEIASTFGFTYEEKTALERLEASSSLGQFLEERGVPAPDKVTALHCMLAMGLVELTVGEKRQTRRADISKIDEAVKSERTARPPRSGSSSVITLTETEKAATVRASPKLPAETTLKDHPLRKLLVGANEDRWSGIILLSNGQKHCGLFLEQGKLTYAVSPQTEHKMGLLFLGLGHAKRDQLQSEKGMELLKTIKEEKELTMQKATVGSMKVLQRIQTRIGDLVVNGNLVPLREFQPFLHTLVEVVLTDAFTWDKGTVRCSVEAPPRYPFFGQPLRMDVIFLHVLANMKDPRQLPFYREFAPGPDTLYKLAPNGEKRIQRLSLTLSKKKALKAVDGKTKYRKLSELLEQGQGERFFMALAASELLVADVPKASSSRVAASRGDVDVLAILKPLHNTTLKLHSLPLTAKSVRPVLHRLTVNKLKAKLPAGAFSLGAHQALLVLHALEHEKYTGSVLFSNGQDIVAVYLKEGKAAMGASNCPEHLLCHGMSQAGMLGGQAGATSLKKMLAAEQKLAERLTDESGLLEQSHAEAKIAGALIQAQLVSAASLFPVLESSLVRMACAPAMWTSGQCQLSEKPLNTTGLAPLSVPLNRVLAAGQTAITSGSLPEVGR